MPTCGAKLQDGRWHARVQIVLIPKKFTSPYESRDATFVSSDHQIFSQVRGVVSVWLVWREPKYIQEL